MKFDKGLLWTTLINLFACILFFYILYKCLKDPDDRILGLVLGWIGWVGMLTFVVAGSFAPEKKREWMSRRYWVGTLLLLLLNVGCTILGNCIAYSLVK